MNAEKQYRKSSFRIIQPKQRGRLSFVDKRPGVILQAKLFNNIQSNEEELTSQQKKENQDTDIYIRPEQEKLLSHEVYAMQKKQGWVQPTMQMKIDDNVIDDRNKLITELQKLGIPLNFRQSLKLMSEVIASEITYSSYQDIAKDIKTFGLGLDISSPSEYKKAINPTEMHGATPLIDGHESLTSPRKITIGEFYRGDKRTFEEITAAGGFLAYKVFTIDQAKHFIASWLSFSMETKKDFSFWWKYPIRRPDILQNDIPFVATGIGRDQMGGNHYKISLPLNFIMFDGSNIGIGYDGETIDVSNTLAIRIDAEEVIFLTKIPESVISLV